MNIIAQLKAERDRVMRQLNGLDIAIAALSGLDTGGRGWHADQGADWAPQLGLGSQLRRERVGQESSSRRLPQLPKLVRLANAPCPHQPVARSQRLNGRDGRRWRHRGNWPEHKRWLFLRFRVQPRSAILDNAHEMTRNDEHFACFSWIGD